VRDSIVDEEVESTEKTSTKKEGTRAIYLLSGSISQSREREEMQGASSCSSRRPVSRSQGIWIREMLFLRGKTGKKRWETVEDP